MDTPSLLGLHKEHNIISVHYTSLKYEELELKKMDNRATKALVSLYQIHARYWFYS